MARLLLGLATLVEVGEGCIIPVSTILLLGVEMLVRASLTLGARLTLGRIMIKADVRATTLALPRTLGGLIRETRYKGVLHSSDSTTTTLLILLGQLSP